MSYTNLIYHIVIRTKNSQPTIDVSHERDLYAYIYGFAKAKSCILYRINGMPDHVHILISISPVIAISDFMRDLKTMTSKFLKQARDRFPLFQGWEREYYASSVSLTDKEKVRQYIINQKEHHKRVNFHEELVRLCRESGINIDERYL